MIQSLAISALLAALMSLARPEGMDSDLIHSDLPLFEPANATLWPRPLGGDEIGCASRVRFGDWRLDHTERERSAHWYRLTNYGVFHCAVMVRDAYEISELKDSDADPSFLVELGSATGREGPVELWILQRGTRPGSSYILLARKPRGGIVNSFDVLQRRCPPRRVREGPELDIFGVRYCAINSRQELIRLAQSMALLEPLGRLTLIGNEDRDPSRD